MMMQDECTIKELLSPAEVIEIGPKALSGLLIPVNFLHVLQDVKQGNVIQH